MVFWPLAFDFVSYLTLTGSPKPNSENQPFRLLTSCFFDYIKPFALNIGIGFLKCRLNHLPVSRCPMANPISSV